MKNKTLRQITGCNTIPVQTFCWVDALIVTLAFCFTFISGHVENFSFFLKGTNSSDFQIVNICAGLVLVFGTAAFLTSEKKPEKSRLFAGSALLWGALTRLFAAGYLLKEYPPFEFSIISSFLIAVWYVLAWLFLLENPVSCKEE